jgi:DNA-binding transcriptional ArsR family regulator
VSIEAIAWAMTVAKVEDPGSAAVLVGLANHADPDGRHAYPSVNRLAYYARLSPRSVQRHLRKLTEDGLIGTEDDTRARDATTRPDQRPAAYRLLMEGERRETFKERQRLLREESEAKNGVTPWHPDEATDCHPDESDGVTSTTARGDNDDSTGCHGVTRTVLEPPLEPQLPSGVVPASDDDGGAQLSLVPDPEPPEKPSRRRPATPLPSDWKPSEDDVAYAAEHAPGLDVALEAEAFRAYHLAHDSRIRNWAQAWRTWVTNWVRFAGKRTGGGRRHEVYRNDGHRDGSTRRGWDEFRQGGGGTR